MVNVSDALLLQVAGIATSLLGFFVVGVFFYVQRGMFPGAADQAQRYMRSATRTVIVLYGMVLFLSLALVAFDLPRVAFLYALLSIVLLWSVVETSRSIHRLHAEVAVTVMSQPAMWLAAAVILATPWLRGGMSPDRVDLASAIALIGVFAFLSSASLVLSAFEISRLEAAAERTESPTAGR